MRKHAGQMSAQNVRTFIVVADHSEKSACLGSMTPLQKLLFVHY